MGGLASGDFPVRSIWRALLTLAQLTVLPAVAGCASTSQFLERHPLERHGAPQTVAVITFPVAPTTRLQAITIGESEGGGVVPKVAAGAYLGLMLGSPVSIVYFPVIVGASAVLSLAALVEANTEIDVPEERAAAIERLAADAIGQLRLPALTAAAIASSTKKFAEVDAAVIDGALQADPSTYRALRERGFGAALEVKMKEIGFEAAGAGALLSLFLTAEATLVDTMTGEPVARRGLVYVSPRHAQEMWTRDGGALTKAETERAYNTLAERMVEDLLLRASTGPAQYGSYLSICGLVPRRPALEWKGGWLAESKVESVTPMLAWDEAPGPVWTAVYRNWDPGASPTDDTPWGRAKPGDITYDLRIWSVVDGAPDALVYERLKLPQAQHRVEVALDPGSTYFWSVRMRYVVDGRLQATRWSAERAVVKYALSDHLKDALFYASADDGTLKRAVCMACQCLDFTPASHYFRFRTP